MCKRRGRMYAGPLCNRHCGLEVPKEVTKNGVILPPIEEALSGSTSFVSRGNEAGCTGRYHHNGTTKKKTHSSGTPVAAAVDAQDVQGERYEDVGNLRRGTSTGKGGTIVVCSAVAATRATSLHGGDGGHRDDSEDRGVSTTEGNGLQEYLSSSDDDKGPGTTEHGNGPAAAAKDAANNGLLKTETKEEKEKTSDDVSGGIVVVETLEGAHSDPSFSSGAKTPSSEWKERGRGPISPVAAMRARVDDALRNLLTLGSEARVSPASSSPSRIATDRSRRPSQPGTRGLSPLSWNRLKPTRRSQEPVSIKSSHDKDFGDDDCHRKQKPGLHTNTGPAANGGLLNITTSSGNVVHSVIDGDMATHNRRGDEQPGVTEVAASHALVDGCQNMVCGADETNHHAGSVSHHKAATSGEGMVTEGKITAAVVKNTRGVLTRDNTLIPRDVWPELLDNEADPHEWSLDKGEVEVLAAARRLGSVLVRVVTWNLHAKPTPAADKLREDLLPPGKVIGY